MIHLSSKLPVRRTELVIRPLGQKGQYVIKDPQTGEFYHLGSQEHFLLMQLDGAQDAAAVRAAFEREFHEPLRADELDEFIDLSQQQNLVQGLDRTRRSELPDAKIVLNAALRAGRSRQSILYWRRSLFNPDRLMTWLEPKIRFFWTRGFLTFSAASILLALVVLWTSRAHVVVSFAQSLRWETALVVWFTLLLVTMLHEFAHGLTCKHFGGEVREIGFLLMFFMPCFYCNVSDAWLFREKSKRLWVTLAGGYFELFLWALAVFAWRLAVPGSVVNYVAFVVLTACGIQSLLNFNPLLKLDGYYLLSDAMEIPNLRQRALDRWKARLRRLLWGAGPVDPEPRGRFLTIFGLVSWSFSLLFLVAMLSGLTRWLGSQWGWFGVGVVLLLGTHALRRMLRGVAGGEVKQMLRLRYKRTMLWLVVMASLVPALCLLEFEDRAGGNFRFRSTARAEIRAPVAGFLQQIYADEQELVSPGAPVLQLELPDLESRLARKRAEIAEAQSDLRLLEAGTRPEQLAAQRERIAVARNWRDVAQQDLERTEQALHEQLIGLGREVARARVKLGAAEDHLKRTRSLYEKKAVSDAEYQQALRDQQAAQAESDRAIAERRAMETKGVLLAESELARRENTLADLEIALTLLETGAPREEIDAAKARLNRLQEELRYLEALQQKLLVYSPVGGIVSTPRPREIIGRFFNEGDPILIVEEPAVLEAEVQLEEHAARRVAEEQPVVLRPRALPLQKVRAHVRRIAITAEPGETLSTVTVYCTLDQRTPALRPGMSGYARISTGTRPLGAILLDRLLRNVRTEYWW